MSKLLVVVDMQNDFVTGALGTYEATQIVHNVKQKILEYMENDGDIIFTMDTHFDNYLDTIEGRNLPVEHCMKNTKGWEIIPEIQSIVDLKEYKIYEKVTFGSSELAKDIMSGLYHSVDEIEFIGLCTDICVISNALLMKAFLPEVPIVVDSSCCAGVSVETHENALNAMKVCQVIIK